MEKPNEYQYLLIKLISGNYLGYEGAYKLGEAVSKLLNLTSLNLDLA